MDLEGSTNALQPQYLLLWLVIMGMLRLGIMLTVRLWPLSVSASLKSIGCKEQRLTSVICFRRDVPRSTP